MGLVDLPNIQFFELFDAGVDLMRGVTFRSAFFQYIGYLHCFAVTRKFSDQCKYFILHIWWPKRKSIIYNGKFLLFNRLVICTQKINIEIFIIIIFLYISDCVNMYAFYIFLQFFSVLYFFLFKSFVKIYFLKHSNLLFPKFFDVVFIFFYKKSYFLIHSPFFYFIHV